MLHTMIRHRTHLRRSVARLALAAGLAGAVGAGAALATPPSGSISRTQLAQGNISEPVSIQTTGDTTFSIDTVTVDPGASSGWHTHPGPEFSIVKGGAIILVEGPDCAPVTLTEGQAFFIPGGTPHLARNEADRPAELYVTYTLPAGKQARIDADDPCPAS